MKNLKNLVDGVKDGDSITKYIFNKNSRLFIDGDNLIKAIDREDKGYQVAASLVILLTAPIRFIENYFGRFKEN